ncbi:MAG: ABC transporter ATP-binding protein [Candidatus Altiarchaeota archaeon]
MTKKHEKHLIELKEVWKTYHMGQVQVHALRGMTLNVHAKEFLAVMGPSGSGKSTALNMVGCLDVPTKGTILLDGIDISKLHESDLAQIRGRKIGFVFQQFNLMPSLTALENVTLPMVFQDISEAERERRGRHWLERMDLGDRMHHRPTELSGGQQQRVAIARALANDPQVILADEPTGNLDTKSGEDVMQLLKDLHKDGKTIVMVTHDPDMAEHAERIAHLRDGKILENGGKKK